ncbi:Cytochrome oxidase assembly protein ShyY1 [Parasphingorhabdus marina DSM 22363]|uniref:SURF1-like protein n=1 Tax=Parasphingorhabdus marina DSM 22363 TaxID=1123272 RepID=A0A1N6CX37_9SPHN|nr:Cytochrome oxidase assembly protein ShyY1 [Parasphingorhabdus marina DSM 22363]
MKRPPIIASLIVAAAVGTMIYLGVWQLDRMDEKNSLLATYAANFDRPAIAFPELGPVADDAMFRKSEVTCLRVAEWQDNSGTAADGTKGFRHLARCVTGAEGPGALINVGVSNRPNMEVEWEGGPVSGWITQAPGQSTLVDSIMGRATARGPMLVADQPLAGLKQPARPSVDDIPNNHFAYAVQWFLFAVIALIIYGIALRARSRA